MRYCSRVLTRVSATLLIVFTVALALGSPDVKDTLQQAHRLKDDNNFAEAAEKYRQVLDDPSSDTDQVLAAMESLRGCMAQLGIETEIDNDLSNVITKHPSKFLVYDLAATQLLSVQHWGVVADQKFTRGYSRGGSIGGVGVNTFEQDRLQALQWRTKALELAQNATPAADPAVVARLQLSQADVLLAGRSATQAWRLQSLTDLSAVPDYLELENAAYAPTRSAPVNASGGPVLYSVPEAWSMAKNDGERLRWTLNEAEKIATARMQARFKWAEFLNSQFSVDTLQRESWLQRSTTNSGQESNDDVQGIATIHTLAETETIAKLASGVKRFSLADEFNPIRLFQTIAASDDPGYASRAAWQLVQIALNRRQYPQAAEKIEAYLKRFGDDGSGTKQQLLDSIRQPRLSFDPVSSQLAGEKAKLSCVFRNATQLNFSARQVDVERLLLETKNYYRNFNPRAQQQKFAGDTNLSPPELSSPGSLFDKANIKLFLKGEEPTLWTETVEPRPNHWDRRQEFLAPLTTAGLYLIEVDAKAPQANENWSMKTRCLVWIQDTVIVQKPGNGKWNLQVADSNSGSPIAGANIEMFGWGYDHQDNNGRPRVIVENFAATSDVDGSAEVQVKQGLQWFSVARTQAGRLALLGFQGYWNQGIIAQNLLELKAYGVSDRPLYRPGETVKAKFWLGYATYGDIDTLRATQRNVTVTMHDSQGNEVAKRQLQTDEFGGCELEIQLDDTTTLGRYSFNVELAGISQPQRATRSRMRPHAANPNPIDPRQSQWANSSLFIRVEEYRKPEFEVKILAPEKPVALGETIQARIEAKYFFGAPVTDATVSVKVERSIYRDNFYPIAAYDWCYSPGYWWFAQDYRWYPGWTTWAGCLAPTPVWRPNWGVEPPELILEQELQLDATGLATIEIDSSIAKAIYGKQDHQYSISVEVRDSSRRTITSTGSVLAAQQPFKIYSWVDRGYYHVGDRIQANFQARQISGSGVTGSGTIDLLRISYDADQKPQERVVASFPAKTNEQGQCSQIFAAEQAGQYRVRLRLTDAANHEIEGGYVFTVRGDQNQPGGQNQPQGEQATGNDFHYNAMELIPDKQHYAPGETVKLQIAANRDDARVAIFIRPDGGNYAKPQWIKLQNKSAILEIPVTEADQPNFFVEAYTVYAGEVHQETREIIVPPAQRVLDVNVTMNKSEYLPGEEAEVEVVVTDPTGKPVVGSCVVAAYDRSLEQIASDVLPPDIREFFWKWQRHHAPQGINNLDILQHPIFIEKQARLVPLGIFGASLADEFEASGGSYNFDRRLAQSMRFRGMRGEGEALGMGGGMGGAMMLGATADFSMAMEAAPMAAKSRMEGAMDDGQAAAASGGNTPTVRKDFADSALWLASLTTDASGHGKTKFKMPENLTSWKLRTWSVASATRVGSASTEAVTRKPLLVRLQTPRFLVERDEILISAIVHNDLPGKRTVQVSLEIDGETQLELMPTVMRVQSIDIESHEQARVDWRCRAIAEGQATLRAIAVTEDASDAMQLELPIIVNGLLKMDSFAGTVRNGQANSIVTLNIPEQRRVEQSRLVVRMSPSLAASMIDALPYLAEYPYGCTEQTLNRFLPSAITQRTLRRMNIDLKSLKDKRNNLNAQELGSPEERRTRWKRFDHSAVFDDELVTEMVEAGVQRLSDMQNGDGGWGWFSGGQETSGAHTTATVVRGLLIAQQNEVAIVPDVLARGVAWLEQYQQAELVKLQNAESKTLPFKLQVDNLDALVFHVLTTADRRNPQMQQILYDQRSELSTYGKALLAWSVHQIGNAAQTQMLRRNIEQFLVQDAENETAYLRDQNSSWWYWYGSNIEANAIYLKLLSAIEPKGQVAPRVVKYLLNNRKHATYWNSTRDTALVVEAFADYISGSGEMQASLTAEVYLSGKRLGRVEFTPQNLFDVDNTVEIFGSAIPAGEQQLEVRRVGEGNLYWNAYATNFTLEEEIKPAGLEVKIERRYYSLKPISKALTLPDAQANIVDTQRTGFERTRIEDLQAVKSGELIETELLIESKNDYEYLLIEDQKAASLETIENQSGYFYSAGLSIYRELRDQHVGLCIRWLPKGKYSIRYRFRSEAPGKFTALPAVIQGMYAPELRGNSADFDLTIVDQLDSL